MLRPFFIKLTLLSLLLIAPLGVILWLKWPISSDLLFYAAILKSFSAQFWTGDLYPRWLMNSNGGFGAPVFLFYSPLLFYVMSMFEWLSPIDPHGFGRVLLGLGLALCVAGFTARHWLKAHLPEAQAQNGALLYAGFPYLMIPIYLFFGIAQLWAYALFPLLLSAADKLAKRGRPALPGFALAYALLCLTHLPSMLIFGGIPCLYVLVFAPKGKRLARTFLAASGAVLAACMAAVYLLPAAANKPYITVSGFLDGKFHYATSFFDIHALLALTIVLLPLAGFYMELPKAMRRLTPHVRFFLAMLAGLLFMTLPLSKPLWDILTPLQYLQGTFRFFIVMLPCVVFIAIRWLPFVRTRLLYPFFILSGLPVAILFSAHTFFFDTSAPSAEILRYNLIDVPEYQTIWMQAEDIDTRHRMPESLKDIAPVTLLAGSGSATVTSHAPRAITLHADIESNEATLSLHRFYFPGWQADTGHIEPRALLSLRVPQGSHDVTLTLPWYEGERLGLIISLGALGVWLALLFPLSRVRERVARQRRDG